MEVSRILPALAATIEIMAAYAGRAWPADALITGGTLTYVAGLGEDNLLTLSRAGDTWLLFDPGSDSIVPGPGCVMGADMFHAECTDASLQAVRAALGDRNDELTMDNF